MSALPNPYEDYLNRLASSEWRAHKDKLRLDQIKDLEGEGVDEKINPPIAVKNHPTPK